MRFITAIDDEDIQAALTLVERMKDHPFVQSRMTRNIAAIPQAVSLSEMWQALLMCLLTTQNKSGFGSSVDTFLREEPFRLALDTCRHCSTPETLIEDVLSSLGIRRWKISAGFAVENLRTLEYGGWETFVTWRERLNHQRASAPSFEQYSLEREAAFAVQGVLRGLGPKQSRNFWQELGLFRYEIPIDSRILKWLNNTLGFYVPVSGLSDEQFYRQVMDVIRELCKRADLVPCLLDAAIFASFENRISQLN